MSEKINIKVKPDEWQLEYGIYALRSDEDCEFEVFECYYDALIRGREFLKEAYDEDPEIIFNSDKHYVKGLAVWKLAAQADIIDMKNGIADFLSLEFLEQNIKKQLQKENQKLREELKREREAVDFYITFKPECIDTWNEYGAKRARETVKLREVEL
jgi:hypothetical protein